MDEKPFAPRGTRRTILSAVWNHFTNAGGKAGRCRYCLRTISFTKGSTSNLKRHLSAKHPNISLQNPNYQRKERGGGPISVKTEHLHQEDPLAESLSLVNEADDPNDDNALGTMGLTVRCAPMGSYVQQSITDEKHAELDAMLIDFLCDEFLPVSMVESVKFQVLVNNLNPNYVLPSKKTVSSALLPQTFEEKLNTVKQELLSAKSVALAADCWENSSAIRFVSLTAHFIDQNFKLTSRLLECSDIPNGFHEENVAQWVSKVLKKFNIESKVEMIVTENELVSKAVDEHTNLKRLPCFAQTLNSFMREGISGSIQSTTNKMKRILHHFKTNTKASHLLSQLENQQPPVKLKQDDPTRWNSTYEMLERFQQNKTTLQSYFDLFKPETTLQTYEWTVIEQALDVLGVFNKATNFISVEKSVTISHIGVLRKMLLDHLGKFADREEIVAGVKTLIRELHEGLTNRLEPFKQSMYVAQAMLLDPRIKKRGFRNKAEEYQQAYETIISELIAIQGASQLTEKMSYKDETNRSNIYSEFMNWDEDDEEDEQNNPRQLAVHEFEMYLKERIIGTDEDPLFWWQANHVKYPTVYNLAARVLNAPCSSIPCEQVFTKVGQEKVQKRARLSAKNCDKVMFLHYN